MNKRGHGMQKEILLEILKQNQVTSHFSFDRVTKENAPFKLNEKAASIGFIYRHIGETINLFCQFFGVPTDAQNTTIGKTDEGQGQDVQQSRRLIDEGYSKLYKLIETQPDDYWLGDIETPFFGTIPRIR